MRPLHLRARNLRSWAELDVEFPAGVVALVGPNGAGKSTYVQAIDLALFAGRGELAREMTRGAQQCSVELVFEHAGEVYRVRRSYEAKGGGKPRLDLERSDPGGSPGLVSDPDWQPLSQQDIRHTEERLQELLGLTRDTYRASSYLAQGEGDAFTLAPPAKRRGVLLEALGVRLWDELRAEAAEELRSVGKGIAGLQAKLEDVAEEARQVPGADAALAQAQLVANERRAAVEDLSQGLEERRAEQQELAAAAARAELLQVSLEDLRRQHEAAQEEDARIANLLAGRAELEAAVAAARGLAEHEEALGLYLHEVNNRQVQQQGLDQTRVLLASAERSQARDEARVDALVAKVAELAEQIANPAAACHACGQDLHGEALARWVEERCEERRRAEYERDQFVEAARQEAEKVEELRARVDAHEAGVAAATDAVGELAATIPAELLNADALAQAQRAARELGALEERLAGAPAAEDRAAQAAKVVELGKALADAEAQYAEYAEAGAKGERAAAAVATGTSELAVKRGELEAAERDVAKYEELLARLQRAASLREELDGRLVAACAREELLGLEVQAYSREGIPALILEATALPHLEAEANAYIGELGRPYRWELRSTRTTQGGDQREALDLVVHTDRGEALYESFSGGERTRLDLSLRLGLARMLAARRGADVQVLIIDEPAYLDEEGMQLLAGLLRRLAPEFGTVLVVSHVPVLRDQFDQVVQIEGGGDTGLPSQLTEA